MGGEAESALVREPLGSRPMDRLGKGDMRQLGKMRYTLISFSEDSRIDKGSFHGLVLSFASLQKLAVGVAWRKRGAGLTESK